MVHIIQKVCIVRFHLYIWFGSVAVVPQLDTTVAAGVPFAVGSVL